jgi:DNA processing protein
VDRERVAYVALALTPGVGAARLATLLSACGTPLGAFSAPRAFLSALPGMSSAAAGAVTQRRLADGARVLEAVERLGAVALLPTDPAFPRRLREIPEPPPLLFAQGDLALLERPMLAVVGSRNHTAYGATVCRLVAGAAAEAGLVVVSGMARGLDAIAHRAALDAGGGTIGLLGNGLGVIYPAANRALYDAVAQRGLLLTEFPPGERPNAGSFPRRNRLISGLARATVVIEAATGSGALITADCALEQGRDVLAVPGPITNPTSAGANRLIRDGATPLLEPFDLFQHYPEVAGIAPGADWSARPAPAPASLDAGAWALIEALGADLLHVDALAERLARPAGELLGRLCALELAGLVEQQAGGFFRRV